MRAYVIMTQIAYIKINVFCVFKLLHETHYQLYNKIRWF